MADSSTAAAVISISPSFHACGWPSALHDVGAQIARAQQLEGHALDRAVGGGARLRERHRVARGQRLAAHAVGEAARDHRESTVSHSTTIRAMPRWCADDRVRPGAGRVHAVEPEAGRISAPFDSARRVVPGRGTRLGRAPRLDDERGPRGALAGFTSMRTSSGRRCRSSQRSRHVGASASARARVAAEVPDPELRDARRRAPSAPRRGTRAPRLARASGIDALLHELRLLALRARRDAEVVDAAFRDARRQRRCVADLAALAGEAAAELGRLPQPLRILRGKLRAQELLRRRMSETCVAPCPRRRPSSAPRATASRT